MKDPLPISPGLWQRIKHFLSTKATGQIVLDVNQGRISSVKINELLKDDTPVPIDAPTVPPLKTRG